jgi:glutathione S-transferase
MPWGVSNDFPSKEKLRILSFLNILTCEAIMKLFYTPGACSMACHITLRELALPFDLIKVDLATGRMETGEDFRILNSKGYVPALKLDNGALLTENQVILQYLVDQVPATDLAPPQGTLERYRLMEWLAFIATELHKGFGPLWNRDLPKEIHQLAKERLGKQFGFVEKTLSGHEWLLGEKFTIADAYLFTVLHWAHVLKMDLSPWPVLESYIHRVSNRPQVKATLVSEGLISSDFA